MFVGRLLIVAVQIPLIVGGSAAVGGDSHHLMTSGSAAPGLHTDPYDRVDVDSPGRIVWAHRPTGSSQQDPPTHPGLAAQRSGVAAQQPSVAVQVPGADAANLAKPADHAGKGQRWQWWTGNRWDAVLPTADGWRLYTDVAGGMDPAAIVDDRRTARVDTVFSDGMLWVARGHISTPRISRYLLNDDGSYVAHQVGVDLPSGLAAANGDLSPLVLLRSNNGRLWVACNNGSNVVVAVSDDDGDTWAAANVLSTSTTGVVMLAQSGGTVVLISTENDGGGRAVRAISQDASDITAEEWDTEKLPALSGVTSDDHGMAVSMGGHIYAVSKTTGADDTQPLLYLLHRTPAGKWSQIQLRPGPDDQGDTRPHILATSSSLHVVYGRNRGPIEAYALTIPRRTLDVPSPATLRAEGDHIDSAVPPREASSRSGLLWIFHDRTSEKVWRSWQPLPPQPTGGLAVPIGFDRAAVEKEYAVPGSVLTALAV